MTSINIPSSIAPPMPINTYSIVSRPVLAAVATPNIMMHALLYSTSINVLSFLYTRDPLCPPGFLIRSYGTPNGMGRCSVA